MNQILYVVAGLATMLALGPMAQGAEETGRPGKRPAVERPAASPLPLELLGKLDLNRDQQEKISRLQKDFQVKLEAAQHQLTEAMSQAKRDQDQQKAEEATRNFRKEVAKFQEDLQEQLQQVLTDEQKRRLAQLRRDQPPEGSSGIGALPRILEQLDLTEEQKEKFGKVMKEFQEKQEAAQKKVQEAVERGKQDLQEKVQELFRAHQQDMAKLLEGLQGQVQQLLTEEQKQRFAELQRGLEGRPPGPGVGQLLPAPIQEGLGLTPEQRERVAKLQQEMEARLRDILTEEQNTKFEELKKGGQQPERRKRQDR